MRRALYFSVAPLTLLVFLGAAGVGSMLGPGMLHPMLRPLSPDLVQNADHAFQQAGALRRDFVVTASDGTSLHGWKVYPHPASGAWVLLFHGMSDNRAGMLGQAQLLLNHGYSLVMMDQRAHGES